MPAMNEPRSIVIKPSKGWALEFENLWNYRELIYFFTWRDLKVRYKQTLLECQLGSSAAFSHHGRFQYLLWRIGKSAFGWCAVSDLFLHGAHSLDTFLESPAGCQPFFGFQCEYYLKDLFPALDLPLSSTLAVWWIL
jgi:hypothetical protein